ncbi:hypothetical protein OE88DRAFT_791865 [Heliocybe sulcata]|uniref:Sugar phosphate transporter domain-containing protein n=1 Tax=Heliocybe sulcata TaxID=5364 RepID=A0A5C3MR30_9AGAM|nr:hypothetical protein OE88DRAFT_791865 [Heliocybe sulcata]
MLTSSAEPLVPSLLASLQGAVCVLLIIGSGYISAHFLLTRSAAKQLSKVVTAIFLPCLMIEQMGPQLTVGEIKRVWVVPIWGLVSTVIAHLWGWGAQVSVFGVVVLNELVGIMRLREY